MREMGARKQLF